MLLGVTGAIFLPQVIHRADNFFASVQQDVNQNVGLVNHGLTRDVDRLDRTLTRDLHRFEAQNRSDLNDLETGTGATMKALEPGSTPTPTRAEAEARASNATLRDTIGALDARITRIEQQLGQ